jgi:hypothetical protein
MLALEESTQGRHFDPGLMGDVSQRTTAGMDCSPQVPAKGVCGRSGVQPLVLEGQRVEFPLDGVTVLADLEQQLS